MDKEQTIYEQMDEAGAMDKGREQTDMNKGTVDDGREETEQISNNKGTMDEIATNNIEECYMTEADADDELDEVTQILEPLTITDQNQVEDEVEVRNVDLQEENVLMFFTNGCQCKDLCYTRFTCKYLVAKRTEIFDLTKEQHLLYLLFFCFIQTKRYKQLSSLYRGSLSLLQVCKHALRFFVSV